MRGNGRLVRLWARIGVLLCASALDAAVPTNGSSPKYLIDTWHLEDGLPQSSITAIVQDGDGFLWLGTEEGLVRFDGARFKVYDRRNSPSLASHVVWKLLEDNDGALWVGTQKGLYRRADGRFTGSTTAHGLPNDDIRALHLDGDGRLWVGTAGGLAVRQADGRFTAVEGLPHLVVEAVQVDRHGVLWVGTQAGLLRRDPDGRTTVLTTADGLPGDAIHSLLEDRRGGLWIGTFGGLTHLDDGDLRTWTPGDGLAGFAVRSLLEGDGGQLWIGTDGGLSRLTGDELEAWHHEDGLPENRLRALLEDRDGHLWIGTRSMGLARLRPRPVDTLAPASSLGSEMTWAFLEDRHGGVWTGTRSGLLHLAADGAMRAYGVEDGLPEASVHALFEDRRGTIWVGTVTRGLAERVDGTFRKVDVGAPLPRVNAFVEDPAGRLWVGTHGGVHRRVDGVWEELTEPRLQGVKVRAFHVDPKSGLWIATEKGLALWHDEQLTVFDARHGLPVDNVMTLHGDTDGTLWLGTWGGGLVRYRDGRFTSFDLHKGLFDVFRILDDGRGRLWMSSNHGVFSVRRSALEELAAGQRTQVAVLAFNERDGLPSRECNGGSQTAGIVTRDGRLWFPTIQGAAILDPDRLVTSGSPPRPVIEEVWIDERPWPFEKPGDPPVDVAPGARHFEFRYSAASFTAAEEVRFRYRLEGFHEHWVEAGSRREAFFTNLPPGRYRFQVAAFGAQGTWSDTATFELDLRPAFYQTPTFLVAAFVVAFGMVWALYRLRLRQALRRQSAKSRLELLETKTSEMEQFIHSVAHDLKSPVLTILGFTGFVERDLAAGKTERAAADLRQVRSAASKMRDLLEELLELTRVGRIALLDEAVSLTTVAREAVDLVAGPIHERGVEVRIEADLPTVRGDRARLVQVFQNLVENSVKYMGDQQAPRIEISACEDRDEVVCRVSDNGIGIDPSHHEKIFRLFDQLDPEAEGSGLGLALVRRIVEAHGGRIRVESEGRGHGAVLCFSLEAWRDLK